MTERVRVAGSAAHAGERFGSLATIGLGCAAVQAVVTGHYLQVAWSMNAPVPIAWWSVAVVAGLVGVPLILVHFGRQAERLVAMPWLVLLRVWVLPALAAHLLWLGACLLVLRRLDDRLAGVPLAGRRDLLAMLLNPAPGFALLLALALFPVLAKLTRALPAALPIGGLCAAAVVAGPAPLLVFLLVGLRLCGGDVTARPSRTGIAGRAAVALIGIAVIGVDSVPDRLGVLIAGLAVLPLGLALAGPARSRVPAATGPAVLVGYLILTPAVALTNKVALARLSALPSAAQLAAAVAEPLVWTAAVLVAAIALAAAGRRIAAVVFAGAARCDAE